MPPNSPAFRARQSSSRGTAGSGDRRRRSPEIPAPTIRTSKCALLGSLIGLRLRSKRASLTHGGSAPPAKTRRSHAENHSVRTSCPGMTLTLRISRDYILVSDSFVACGFVGWAEHSDAHAARNSTMGSLRQPILPHYRTTALRPPARSWSPTGAARTPCAGIPPGTGGSRASWLPGAGGRAFSRHRCRCRDRARSAGRSSRP